MQSPDLSAHLGRSGEFVLGLFGLLLLLLMHPQLRAAGAVRAQRTLAKVKGLHGKLVAGSFTHAQWVRAIRLIFTKRRWLYVIVIALVVFEYFYVWYVGFMFRTFTLYESDPILARDDWLGYMLSPTNIVMGTLRYLGYALFLARAVEWSGDTPRGVGPRQILGLGLCIYGATTLAAYFTPSALFTMTTAVRFNPSFAYVYALTTMLAALSFLIGAKLFSGGHSWLPSRSARAAILGFILAVLVIEWLFHFLRPWPIGEAPWLFKAAMMVRGLSYDLLWFVALAGFAVVLARDDKHPSRGTH